MKQLSAFPRAGIVRLPSLLEPLPRLSAALGGPTLWVKRDDQIGLAIGGNKTRKLDFLMGEALARGASRVITFGGPQSNHARQTAAAARRLGLDPILVLIGDEPAPTGWQGNLLLDRILGADVRFAPASGSIDWGSPDALLDLIGLDPGDAYVIPPGGSCPVGILGYGEAAGELLAQAQAQSFHLDAVVTATGTGGTAAGLLLGFWLAEAPTQVVAIDVGRLHPHMAPTIVQLAQDTAALLGLDRPVPAERLAMFDYTGPAYAQPTKDGLAAIRQMARQEGLLLDPVYTGKALAGLIDLIQRGYWTAEHNVVLIHTGGTPALYVDPGLF
ncbi:MAG: pyridoxal-phosphate dependent enzyme [Chloroflexi bacterium]|nr:pyridoxal-phosphate dependent enzyme [Chloroflexota bacterium]MBU1749532.1 pyridoxal-phosphate dependent enzyme [Chloroflexota bacterium]